MKDEHYDFSGYATKNDLLCSDGRVIRHGAFADCDGNRVPIFWQHEHDIDRVLGHADLENRDDGVYAYCSLNPNTDAGKMAIEHVAHGDVTSMSIYANQLKQHGNEVLHGNIREVSLVVAGANPGAYIDTITLHHSDGYIETVEDEAVISVGESFVLTEDSIIVHADDDSSESDEQDDASDDKTIEEVYNSLTDNQKLAVSMMLTEAGSELGLDIPIVKNIFELQHDDDEPSTDGVDMEAEFESMPDKTREAMLALVAGMLQALAQNDSDEDASDDSADADDEAAHTAVNDDSEETIMHANFFDGTNEGSDVNTLTHEDMTAVITTAQRTGSMKLAWKDYAESHELAHGIVDIDNFFPEPQTLSQQPPAFISRRMEWVGELLNATGKSPFGRIRTMGADITMDEARARGYIKGNKKVEEQFTNFRRVTTPQTIVKLQKLDRDDIIDITDFDVVAWIKGEMRMMLNEEVARAVLIGDGRLASSQDKIKEDCIRPIWKDDDLYTIKTTVNAGSTDRETALDFVDACVRARKNYLGSGTPTMFIGTDLLTELRLLKDADGYRLYKSDSELASDLRVSRIVEVQLLDNQTRETDDGHVKLGAIIVNPSDYTIGANKGGETTLFDDFDIDYNKYTYMIETRICGALTQPYSAIAVEIA